MVAWQMTHPTRPVHLYEKIEVGMAKSRASEILGALPSYVERQDDGDGHRFLEWHYVREQNDVIALYFDEQDRVVKKLHFKIESTMFPEPATEKRHRP